jgi:putative MATE family efflux protein
LGAGQDDEANDVVHTAITIAAILGVIVGVIGFVACKPLLIMMDSPIDVLDHAALYMRIIFIGMPAQMVYNYGAALLRAKGDTKRPLYFLMVSGAVNVICNLIFVIVFHLDVAGVALATIIAQIVSATLCFIKLARMRSHFDFGMSFLRLKGTYVKTLVRLGIPSGLTQAIFSSAMIIVQSLTNCFGEQFIAANVVIMRVDGFAMMPNFSFGTALTTYAGQNVGAGLYDRVTKGAKQGTFLAVACSTTITAAILFFGKPLMHVFTDTNELVELSYRLMLILAVGYIAVAVTQSLSGIMRGAGDTMTPMWISLITTVLVRVPVAYGISFLTRTAELPYGRQECIQISLLASWVIGAVLTAIFYRFGKWKTKAIK